MRSLSQRRHWGPKELSPYSCVSPLKSSRDSSTLVSKQSPTHCSHRSRRHGRSAVDQVTLLTQDIEDNFSAKKKARSLFVDLKAGYDTVWNNGLTCKLLLQLSFRLVGWFNLLAALGITVWLATWVRQLYQGNCLQDISLRQPPIPTF